MQANHLASTVEGDCNHSEILFFSSGLCRFEVTRKQRNINGLQNITSLTGLEGL